jgi:murein DD-endopeptidase MepM/ murein hydrolase activator NlpD
MNVLRSPRSIIQVAPTHLRILALLGLWAAVAGADSGAALAASEPDPLCQQPALARVIRHRIASGETIASIAQQYNLIPATLMGFNAALQNGNAPAGTEIFIPPYNGVRVEVPTGSTWRDIAKSYGIRADVLFETNGCQEAPRVVFVPGVNWSPARSASPPSAASSAADPLTRYPLPATAAILQGYGWQLEPATSKVVFNSGVDLEAAAGTQVLAAGAGTVAFAGEQANSKMVVINHSQGLQTRYTQLATLSVQVGQQVQAGDRLGTLVGTLGVGTTRLHFEVRSNSNLGWVAQDPGNYIPQLKRDDRGR